MVIATEANNINIHIDNLLFFLLTISSISHFAVADAPRKICEIADLAPKRKVAKEKGKGAEEMYYL